MMKTIIKFLTTAIVLMLLSTSSFAQANASASAQAEADIVAPLAISWVRDLIFANVAVSATIGGTVILAPDVNIPANRTATGGVTLPIVTGDIPQSAQFLVTGEGSYVYDITLPGDVTIYHDTDPTKTMIVNTWLSFPSGQGTLTLGQQNLYVGATLNVSNAQTPGHYQTDANGFTVTVNYN